MVSFRGYRKKKSVKSAFFLQSLLKNCLMILIPILMIAPFTIWRSLKESTKEVENNTFQTLIQVDNTVNILYSHLDNSTIFFSSNPQVTTQLKKAFYEKSLSLDSLRNMQNLSLYFQNLIYTDPYIKTIYIYFDNDYNRIFMPPQGALQQMTTDKQWALVNAYDDAEGADFWIETIIAEPEGEDALVMFQKLYQRGSSNVTGFIAFEFDMYELEHFFQSLVQYDERFISLLDSQGEIVYTNSAGEISPEELALLTANANREEAKHLFKATINGESMMAACLDSERENGFTYITFAPLSVIYKNTSQLSVSYIILTVLSVFLCFFIALYKTRKEYTYLYHILDIFSNPEAAKEPFKDVKKTANNPFEYIILNIIQIFVANDYLKMRDSKREYELRELKNQALQYQINPHFLHNTLNTIYWEAVKLTTGENGCSKMVSNLSLVMRYIFSSPEEDVPVKEEISYLDTYLEIMSERYSERFAYHFHIDSRVEEHKIKKMLLQPLVENAISHGVKDSMEFCHIHVGVRKLGKSVLVYVLDTGKGIDEGKLAEMKQHLAANESIESNHVGISNTNLRLRLSYGERSTLRIKSLSGQYTLIYFYLPYLPVNPDAGDSLTDD